MAARRKRKGGSPPRRPQTPEPAVHKRVPRRRWPIALIVVLAGGLGIAGYQALRPRLGRSLPPAIDLPHGAAAGFNVVLITLDTLRADRVGCYGYRAAQTPVLDGLAADGLRFADAVTVVPMTLPAHASILTGEYPPVHGVRDNGTYRLVAERESLAERLRGEGYATAAFIAAFVLDRRYGLDQGFEVYDDRITPDQRSSGVERLNPQRPGNVVTDSAIRWLEEHQRADSSRPFFAWVHLFDPHTPYSPPEPFATRFASNPYDGEVAFTDQQVGRFVDRLRELKLLDRTLVVLVGDHGEGLGDHGESTHSLLIYGASMRVPLIFYSPALIPGGQVVDDRVTAVVDIKPTICDLLGLDPAGGDGVSLLQAGADADRVVYLETLAPRLNHGWSALYALRRHGDKYIEAPTPEYYDLRADPQEQGNLWPRRRRQADPLADRLAALMASFPAAAGGGGAAVALDEAAIEKLASLGYLRGGSVQETGPLPDPKDMIARSDRPMRQVHALVDGGRHAAAIPLIQGLLAVTPADSSLWSLLSIAQAQAGLPGEAIASRTRSIELQPNDPNAWLILANLQYATGDVEGCRVSLAEAERLEPELGEIYLVRARHALSAGQHAEAIAQCRLARQRDPTRYAARSWSLEGSIHEQMGRPSEAETAYARAYELDPSEAAALLGLARVAQSQDRFETVIRLGRSIAPGRPEWAQSRVMLARAYLQTGQDDQAVRTMTEWVAAAPDQPGVHSNLGAVFLELGRYAEAEACFRAALQLDPGYAKARKNLDRALQAQKEVDGQDRTAP